MGYSTTNCRSSDCLDYVPEVHWEKSPKFLRHDNGLDVYLHAVTGTEVFVGWTGGAVR